MKRIISKQKGWNRQWDCVLKHENGTQAKATLDESEVLRLELEEKLGKLIAMPVLNEIISDLEKVLQSKYEEAMNDAVES